MYKSLRVDNEPLFREISRLLQEGKRIKLKAKGNSMRPVIHNGDTLEIAPARDFGKGDIVLARPESGRYLIHRIIGLTRTGFILMGDNNLYGKENCDRKDVFGKVVSRFRNGEEQQLNTKSSRIKAMFRRLLLPLRRMKQKVMR